MNYRLIEHVERLLTGHTMFPSGLLWLRSAVGFRRQPASESGGAGSRFALSLPQSHRTQTQARTNKSRVLTITRCNKIILPGIKLVLGTKPSTASKIENRKCN